MYLHWGFEVSYPDAHHSWINTAYHHNVHHMKSVVDKPYHTGFFFQVRPQCCARPPLVAQRNQRCRGYWLCAHVVGRGQIWDKMMGSVYTGECVCAKW